MSELSVAILWHMHQPFYRPVGGSFRLPWVYLHAIREYHDMAAWLEEVPEATVNVNFTPSLVVQLEEYDRNLRAFFSRQAETTGDRLLDVLAHGAASVPPQDRRWVIAQALRAHETHMIARFPAFARLAATARQVLADGEAHWVSDAFVDDLIVWYHLAWMGETVRSTDLVCQRLLAKEKDYTAEDRRTLLARIHALIAEVLPRWKRLAARGQVELSTTPYAHPILPLLLDFTAARATEPEAEIPDEPYPGGKERARWHIEAAMRTHARVFGEPPRGVWPAEGGVSSETLALFAASGFQWAATGEAVLNHSLGAAARAAAGASPLYAPWRVDTPEGPMALVFRDDRLSDKIGFEYQHWDQGEAVRDLVRELEAIHARMQGHPAPLVALILDGENAWSYYPEGGALFLRGLYRALAEHPKLKMTTIGGYLDFHPPEQKLERLVPGSWVFGTFSTWIGHPAKTEAWRRLIRAKRALDRAWPRLTPKAQEAALEALAICEGSDWTWWLAEHNPDDTVQDFDALYRAHLSRLYELIGEKPPKELNEPLMRGQGGAEMGGVMQRSGS